MNAKPESDALLDFLFEWIKQPELQLRYRWSEGDVALWDNRCAQHFALWDYWPNERKGHRVTIRGERPYFDGNLQQRSNSLHLSRQKL